MNDTQANFSNEGFVLHWRINFSCIENCTPLLRNITINYNTETYPSNISIDIGKDGTAEWTHPGILNSTIIPGNLTGALNAYIQSHRTQADAEGYVSVPLNISSATGGIISIKDASADITPLFPRVLDCSPQGSDVLPSTPITVHFSEPMNGTSVNITIAPSIALTPAWSTDKMNLTLSHDDFRDASYNVTVSAGALSERGSRMLENFSWEFWTLAPPRVVSSSPGGTDVPLNLPIIIEFNGIMNGTSVNVTAIPPIELVSRWSENGRNITLEHQGLQPGTLYNVTVHAGARLSIGAAMPEDFSWEFRTALRPEVISSSPTGENVSLDAAITVSFSCPMDTASFRVDIQPNIALYQAWTSNGTNLSLSHDLFEEETVYCVTIPSSSLAANGVGFAADVIWTFTTLMLPKVVSFSPTGGGVRLSSRISFMFNKPMNQSSVISAFDVQPGAKGKWVIENGGMVFSFIPASGLRPNADYELTIRGTALDLDGNPLEEDFTWYFSTGPAAAAQRSDVPWWPILLLLIAATAGGVACWRWRVAALSRPEKKAPREIYGSRPGPENGSETEAPAPASAKTPAPASEIATAPAMVVPAPGEEASAQKDIFIETSLGFQPDLVIMRVALSVRNARKLDNASLKLVYDDEALRLERVEPGYTVKGDEIVLGMVSRNRMELAINFRPLKLAETVVEGLLIFKDHQGKLRSLELPATAVSIARPELLTDSNLTITKLMHKMAEESDWSGSRLFRLPSDISPRRVFDIGKASVQRHDMRLVQESTEKAPFIGEAWYFGKARNGQDSLVVRVRFFSEKDLLEFFVMGSSASMLTGMLLALKSDLFSEFIAGNLRPAIRELPESEEAGFLATKGTLLGKIMDEAGREGIGS